MKLDSRDYILITSVAPLHASVSTRLLDASAELPPEALSEDADPMVPADDA